MLRKLGILLCLLGLVAVCFFALNGRTKAPFSTLESIQQDIFDRAEPVLLDRLDTASLSVSGRVATVTLPDAVPADFNELELRRALREVDGVRSVIIPNRESVDVIEGGPPAPEPTVVAIPTSEPPPTEAPEPTPEPTPVASLAEIVAGFDLGAIEFEPGTAVLTASAETTLLGIATEIEGAEGVIEVQAHTDNTGDPDVNLLLSQERAEATADFLNAQGIAADLTPRGYGASLPIADNSTEQGRADNQRVEFVVEGN